MGEKKAGEKKAGEKKAELQTGRPVVLVDELEPEQERSALEQRNDQIGGGHGRSKAADDLEWIAAQKIECEIAIEAHAAAERRVAEARIVKDKACEPLAAWLHVNEKKTTIAGVTYRPVKHRATIDGDGNVLASSKGKRAFSRDTYTLIKDGEGAPV